MLLTAVCSNVLLVDVFYDPFVAGECATPKPLEVCAERVEACRIQAVNAPRTNGMVHYQSGVLQHAEMLRDRRTADRKLAGDLHDGARTLRDALENGAASRIAECRPRIQLVRPRTVSYSLPFV